MKHIFISYAHEDRSGAFEVCETLEQGGYPVWLDKVNLLPGQDWKREIERAIRESEIFIACLSHNSVNKRGFVQSELKRALEVLDTIPEGDIFIIPVRFDECVVPSELSKLHWLNFFESNAKERLVNAIQFHLKIAEEFSSEASIAKSQSLLAKLIKEANLSETQMQILEYDRQGYSNQEIAMRLNTDIETIYSRRSEVLRKLAKSARGRRNDWNK